MEGLYHSIADWIIANKPDLARDAIRYHTHNHGRLTTAMIHAWFVGLREANPPGYREQLHAHYRTRKDGCFYDLLAAEIATKLKG